MTPTRAAMFWSGGKDSALALDRVRRSGGYQIETLITTINPEFGRVSMHGVREPLAEAQAAATGLPLDRMYVGSSRGNDDYVAALRAVLRRQRERGVEAIVFGDIFLADLRAWREQILQACDVTGVFPLWGDDTARLAGEFVSRGFKAVLCCANDANLDETVLGREMDARFFADLPASVDPCGENGEYHSFVYDGPIFDRPIGFRRGECVYRPLEPTTTAEEETDGNRPQIPVPSAPAGTLTKGFWFIDLLPES